MPSWCPAEEDVRSPGLVTCDLTEGHPGLHYCELYDIAWTKGRPDDQV